MTADPVLQKTPTQSVGPQSRDAGAAVTLRPLPMRSVLNLRGPADDPAFFAAVEKAIAVELPTAANTWAGGGDRFCLWLGPDEWMIVAPAGQAEALETAIRDGRPEDPWLSVTDISHNFVVLELSGPKARSVLSKACPLDLHPRAFGANACAQTILARTRMTLRLVQPETPVFEMWVRNSFARYAAEWLEDAMIEYNAPATARTASQGE